MKTVWDMIKRSFSRYFGSAWIPFIVMLCVLGAHVLYEILGRSIAVTSLLCCLFVASLIMIPVVAVYQFVKKMRVKGFINLGLFAASLVIGFFVMGYLMFWAMFGPSEDGFGKDIVIPPDMEIEEPFDVPFMTNNPAKDPECEALVAAFKNIGTEPQKNDIPVDLKVLNEFSGPNRNVLFRHLATNAKWFVTRERGKAYACRRCAVKGQWQNTLNGYYTGSTFDMWSDSRFQFRVILGPDGPVMSGPWKTKATMARVSDGQAKLRAIEDKRFAQGIESYLVLESDGAAMEIFEQSQSFARPFTPLALAQVKTELEAVLASSTVKEKGFDPALMPPQSMKDGGPELHIANGMQGGIYFIYAYINPGEPGYVYLKVFEATKNTPLSTSRIPDRSCEYVGWSTNPQQQFFHNTQITVYEGDWEVYYPGRFELWFVPDSGRPERKLIEKTFKIEGWMR